MGQQANIVAFDGAATPVSHTLVPEGIERLKDGTLTASWKESLSGVPDYAQVRALMTKRRLPSGTFRVSSRGQVPVMESISGQNVAGYTAPPKVAHTATTEVVGYYHERSTVTDRRLSRQLALNMANGLSTTQTVQTTGPGPELFDQLIFVS